MNYGYGYGGVGYYGGRWDGGAFRYNTAITRVNVNVIHNTYIDRNVVHNGGGRASFNGPGGTQAHATPEQLRAAQGQHVGATSAQTAHVQDARGNHQLLASVNHGHPSTMAANSVGGAHGPATEAHGDNAGGFHGKNAPETHVGTPANNAPQTHAATPTRTRDEALRARNDGLSPDERNVVNRRQAALNRQGGGEQHETAGRSRDAALRSAGNPGGGQPHYSEARVNRGGQGGQPQAVNRGPAKGQGGGDKHADKKDKKGDRPQ